MLTPKPFVDGVGLTSSAATYYTCPAEARAVIKAANFTNNDSSPVTVTVNLVPSAGSANYENQMVKTKSLAAAESWNCPFLVNQILNGGGFISMLASSTGKVGVRISGYEVT